MKCPECDADNRGGVKFREECGAKIEVSCPKCGAIIPGDKKFCGGCGQSLVSGGGSVIRPEPRSRTLDEEIYKIQKYLPEGLTEKILSQRDRIEGSGSR